MARADALVKHFTASGHTVAAVDHVSFVIGRGETLAVIGESGSGKSTLARLVLALVRPDSGSVRVFDEEIFELDPGRLRQLRARMQAVFQEPLESLDPRMRVEQIVEEPLRVHRRAASPAQRRRTAREMLLRVGVPERLHQRRPAALSGGEQQRVGIARAIVTHPELVVLDEPTSSLDLSLRAGVLALLRELQRELGMSYLFISHDIGTVSYISDRLLVMYRGCILESGPTAAVLAAPLHPYTQALLAARLPTDPRVPLAPVMTVSRPDPAPGPPACPFFTRCPLAMDGCVTGPIPVVQPAPGREVACLALADSATVVVAPLLPHESDRAAGDPTPPAKEH